MKINKKNSNNSITKSFKNCLKLDKSWFGVPQKYIAVSDYIWGEISDSLMSDVYCADEIIRDHTLPNERVYILDINDNKRYWDISVDKVKYCGDKNKVSPIDVALEGTEFAPPLKEEGLKLDDGKPRWSLLPFRELKGVVEILTFGAKKYAPGNWKKVSNATERYSDAALRHLTSWLSGEKKDPESGKSHLAHVACNILFLMWFENEGKE